MAPASLFQALRGSDGRSIARALIGLLLLATFIGGVNSGALASPTPGFSLCASAPSDGGAGGPAHRADQIPDCCFTGHLPLAAPPAGAPAVAAADVPAGTAAPDFSAWRVPARTILIGTGPRGPPLLA
jgi:hypothetical protein